MAKVTFFKTHHSLELDYGSDLIEIEDIDGNQVPFGCHSGSCGTCVIRVIEGGHNLSPINQDEIELLDDCELDKSTHRLACQCVITGDITIDPLNE